MSQSGWPPCPRGMNRTTPLLIVLVLAACGGASQPTPNPTPSDLLQSSQQRILTPNAAPSDVQSVAAGNNAFALDLFHAVQSRTGNLFFSPYGINVALAMAYAGANGATAQQMSSVLHYTLPLAKLEPAFDALDLSLNGRTDFELHVVDATWGEKGFPFLGSYLDTLAENFGAGMHVANFAGNPDGVRTGVNTWVSNQTAGRIPELVAPNVFTPATVLALVNAVYFKGAWSNQFPASGTAPAAFHALDGTQTTVSMMNNVTTAPYFQGLGFQAVDLPYADGGMSMLVVVPDPGQFDTVQGALTPDLLAQINTGLAPAEVTLGMPKFTIAVPLDSLGKTLAGMGMPDAFSTGADFSGMDGAHDLSIADVIHKAYVSVDENGTEATAATVVVVVGGVAPPPPNHVTLAIDRPFFAFIHDTASGAILFFGRVESP